MKLVIVESPAKSKTIGRYLGKDYIVEASVGHISDLATTGKGGLGVDVENNFKATYVISKDKKKVVNTLKKLKKEADEVILATDPDREGEAIAYHLANTLDLSIENTKRLEFHEITKDSISNAILNPRTINMKLVQSQETRRILDRIIGFKLSTLLQRKIHSKSAGRVQSVVLKLICDHEEIINNFIPAEYWTIESSLSKNDITYNLELVSIDGDKTKISDENSAKKIIDRLINNKLEVKEIKTSKRTISSKEPFRTSTLQQEASSKFKYKTKDIALIAQKLYEGVEIGNDLVGLITYMRTDSTKLSDSFILSAKDNIISTYGEEYYNGPKENKNVKNSQDAHEAIRPTDISRTPKSLKPYLSSQEYKIYKLIYERTLASLMTAKVMDVTTITFNNDNIEFHLIGNIVTFKGFDILKIDDNKENEIPNFEIGEKYEFETLNSKQNFTKAPARYSEGKLVKLMEDKGIGRPSTYSSTIQTLIQRKYITNSGGIITPTEQGKKTSFVLTKYFPNLMSTEYTAQIETNLDKIQEGELEEVNVLSEFYNSFMENFNDVKDKMYKDPPEYTGETCPLCGGQLVKRHGKNGEFVSCGNYPNCTYIKREEKDTPIEVGRNCPNCGKPLIKRKSRYGTEFVGCSGFPTCKYIEPVIEYVDDHNCPKCGGRLMKRFYKGRVFIGCSNYPNCDYSEKIKKDEKDS